eukprot:6438428-Prymnesium_polylepis.1
MAGEASWAGRGFERGAARRRMSPPCARRRPTCGDLAQRSLACLAVGSQRHKTRHSVRIARRGCWQRR